MMRKTFELSGTDALKIRGAAVLALVCLAGVLAFAGCAARTSPALDHAESVYGQARAEDQISPNAALEMDQAHDALDRAHHALEHDASDATIRHYSYLAEQRVAIARAISDRDQARNAIDAYNSQRESVLLGARTQEAAQAQARARQLSQQLANARETRRGLVLDLGDILFETGRAELKPGAMKNLYQLATYLQNHPDRNVSVEGYTDDVGAAQMNRELSQARADAVRDFLIRNGISPDRVQAKGFGEAYPIAPNETAAGRQENRRVEVVIGQPGEVTVEGPGPRR